ncbi:ABC transporter ATP-binding protein [Oceanibaculum pacificum]|uniref:Microcin ABC transporter ATP-binding protein n=1 Tax=Oceanibaculum pacificum TaxID=580166 RepID=A0A154W457_9PROT|nr:ABC transporter ATP-binding protein [Oceanibaculum pacificum]KZD08263.1 microcin ABC transporter ATP-binding protein [Oceanibaculum pacificum]
MTAPLLAVENLSVRFTARNRVVEAVKHVSFTVAKGETVALVGESGSGKSVSALSILQLLPYPAAQHPSGSIRYRDMEMMGQDQRALRKVRGNEISMIFQEPMTSLNPLHIVERQIGEILAVHRGLGKEAARARTIELLEQVGLDNVEQRLGSYPHQLSGGQRQRVMIAMALACRPKLLIADEPTTALDVTIQAQILLKLRELKRDTGMSMLFITHDLGIVRKMADRVYVMTQGEVVEHGPVAEIFANPQHPYTQRLLAAEPKGRPAPVPAAASEMLAGEGVKVWFPVKRGVLRRTVGHVKAVDGVDLAIREGETVGVVGESGSGKTTLGLALLRLERAEGVIRFDGAEISALSTGQLRPLRREMQIVFQDPFSSLSPRLSVADIVGEGLAVHRLAQTKAERDRMIDAVLEEVGIDPAMRFRYPHEFSGGQRQRVAIARAMVLKPRLVVLDEPTSALDMSVQAQIVELLRDLQARHGLAYMFISHDLKVVRALAHQVIVLRQGKVVEQGPADAIFDRPADPYTKALMKAAFDLEAVEDGVVKT